MEENIRLSNISKMTEPSYGSPSRFIGKSPNPRDQTTNRAHRPAGLAFDGTQSDHAGPKSAPAHVKSFDDRARDEGFRPWNPDEVDDRWHRRHDEMPSSISNSTSRQSSHWDLLQAQLGYPAVQPNGQDQNGTTPSTSGTRGEGSASEAIVGRGYDNLARYVAIASSGQQCSQVPELERLMLTMLDLRGDDNFLLSIDRAGRDTVRRYMYEQIFDDGDGSSRLSRDNPKGLVDVGGELMTQEALHHQIICFLEDKLEEMTRSPSPQANTPHMEFQSAQHHRPDPSFTEWQHLESDYADRPPPANVPHSSQRQHSPPAHNFEALRIAQQQGGAQQAWQGSRLAEISNFNQIHPREDFETRPNPSNGAQVLAYGQHPQGMVPQQSGGPFSQQFVGPHGVFYGNPYAPPPVGPVGYYHGGQAVPQAGPMLPYGPQYLRMPQQGNPMNATQFMPNQQMVMNPYQQPWAQGPAYMMQPPPSQWPPVPGYLGSVYGSLNRAQSPLTRSTDSPSQARAGRNVISEVALLPYRAGSDDMLPYGQQGGSVQFQELTRNGGPTYDQATRPEILPFVENARKAKPAEWGVLRIGNVSPRHDVLHSVDL
ncbi:MAG: hypothetical protein Q9226_002051 [Calogaya cf. arnoldii]